MASILASITIARLADPALLTLVVLGVALARVLRERQGARPSSRALAAWAAFAALWIASTPLVASALTRWLVVPSTDLAELADTPPEAIAIVVLGGGAGGHGATPRECLSGPSALRVITAARVWSATRAGRVIVTGARTEAGPMADLLLALGVPDAAIERDDRASNTRDNAEDSARLLRGGETRAVIVVTSTLHLRRAVREFARAGVHALPVGTGEQAGFDVSLEALLPSAGALAQTHAALHEWLGLLK